MMTIAVSGAQRIKNVGSTPVLLFTDVDQRIARVLPQPHPERLEPGDEIVILAQEAGVTHRMEPVRTL